MLGNVNRITIAGVADTYSFDTHVSLLRIYCMEVWVGNRCGVGLVCNDTD